MKAHADAVANECRSTQDVRTTRQNAQEGKLFLHPTARILVSSGKVRNSTHMDSAFIKSCEGLPSYFNSQNLNGGGGQAIAEGAACDLSAYRCDPQASVLSINSTLPVTLI